MVAPARGITAATGDVWAFNATMFGSTDGWVPSSPMRIVGIGPRGAGQGPGSGYHLVAADGATIHFGLAPYSGHVRGKGWNS